MTYQRSLMGPGSATYAPLALPSWAATTAYLTGQQVLDPSGNVIVRISAGTSRASFDVTELALWNRPSVLTTKRFTGVLTPAGASSGALTAGNEICTRRKNTVPFTPTRFRLKVSNFSIATNAAGGSITLTAAYICTPVFPTAAGDNRWAGLISGSPVALSIPTTAIPGTQGYITSDWYDNSAGLIQANVPHVLSVGVKNNNGTSSTCYYDGAQGYCWIGAGASTTVNSATPSGVKLNNAYIDVQIEYEYTTQVEAGAPHIPVGLFVGDSLTSGVVGMNLGSGTAATHYDENWVGLAAIAAPFAPINIGVGGSTTTNWVANWTRYLSRADIATTVPDFAVVFLDANDVNAAASAATIEANIVTIVGSLQTAGIKRIYLATQFPLGWANSFTTTATTASTTVLTAIPSTYGMYRGMAISGTGIPASTSIASVDSPTQVTMSASATASASGVTITVDKPASSYVSTAAKEVVRQTVNEWIRTQPLGVAGVIDFDKWMRVYTQPGMTDADLISVYPHPDPGGYAFAAGVAAAVIG